MKFEYNKLVHKVDTYLRRKRSVSKLWACMLPEKLFTPELWVWEPRSVAVGAAWGASWAIAPVPLQTIFTVLCSVWTRGNVPVSVLACCISFPGYQVIAWPLQWYAGAWLLRQVGISSGVTLELMRDAALAATQGWDAAANILSNANILILSIEFLLGCAMTCAAMWVAAYCIVCLVWGRK